MTKEQIEELKAREFVQSSYSGGWPLPNGEAAHGDPLMILPKGIVLRLLEEREKLLGALRAIRTHVGRALNDGGAPMDGCAHNGEDYFGGECISWAESMAHPAIAFAEEEA